MKVEVLIAQLCPTLCNPTDSSPLGFSVHGILQARILEWVAIHFSRGSSPPNIEPGSSALQADSLLSEPPGSPIDVCILIWKGKVLEKEMATHFSTLAWRIPWTEERDQAAVHGIAESDRTVQLTSAFGRKDITASEHPTSFKICSHSHHQEALLCI